MVHAAPAESGLSDRKGLTLTAEHMVGGHPDVVVADVAVSGAFVGLTADATLPSYPRLSVCALTVIAR